MLVGSIAIVQEIASEEARAAGIANMPVDLTLPHPTNICGKSGLGEVTLTWDRMFDPQIDGFVVQYRPTNGFWTDGPTLSPSAKSVDIAGASGVTYEYRIASTSAGSRSDWGSYCLLGWGGAV